MLRLHTGRDAEGAKAYFDQGLSREDYYSEGCEVKGTWHGMGAKQLGLSGEVDRELFHALCDNINPKTGEKLTARTKENRRVGFDISFSVPKSVSIHQAVTESEEILEAFQESVRETMAEMERDAETRVRKNGANHNRKTANLTWAEFIHYTARPVEGRSDPHLHAHCWTFNSTFDEQEDRWKALDLESIWKRAPYYEAAFEARLAKRLTELGYEIEENAKGWELKGYSRETIEGFSRRTQLINEFAAARGIEDDRLKDQIGARTREAKQENEDKARQREEWRSRLSKTEQDRIQAIETRRAEPKGISSPTKAPAARTPAQCLDHAIGHCFERQSVMREAGFLAEALKHGTGSVTVEQIRAEVERRTDRGDLIAAEIGHERHFTTPEVLKEEQAMVKWAREGRGRLRSLGTAPEAKRAAYRELTSGGRNPDSRQIAAVDHVLTSQDRVTLIRGKAGTGKTTMMRAARDGIEAGGKEVFFFAPGAEASRGVLVNEGFDEATTVAKLLHSDELQERVQNQVIWVDEAGTLGARDMHRLFEVAERTQARVILSGDVSQHAPVARGDALRILETEAGLKPAELDRIYRQTNRDYREAVELLSRGDARSVAQGFEKLDEMGAIREVDAETRYQELAQAYLDCVIEEKKSALVVSPTHREGEKVTATIREGLREAGRLDTKERSFTRLKSLHLTAAERADVRNYTPGLVVQAHGRVAGLKRGQKYEVVGTKGDAVQLRAHDLDGTSVTLPLARAEAFEVYARDEVTLSAGDRIRITRNGMAESRTASGRKQGLNNGAIYEIDSFTEAGDIEAVRRDAKGRTTSRVVIGREFGNLTHGYCVTSHASQGKTVDRVLIAQSSESFRASSREQFYVSVSRGRESAVIFTDDKERLRGRVMDSTARTSATELARGTREAQRMQSHVLRTQRLLREAGDYARAQAARLMRLARGTAPPRERRPDGPERTL